jgi:cation diffusion facilitator family transporter
MGGHDHSNHAGKDKKAASNAKKVAFFAIGSLTMIYCLAELAAALYINSLTLLSDGFHNLSDVVSLYIAYWAQNAAQRDQSDEMSYGWARTEILGGLSNGCFLLSLCLYVALEAIPKLIRPTGIPS